MMSYLIPFLCFLNIIYSIENIALVIKKKGDVEHKKFDSSQFNSSVYRNKSLYNDDVIRTGDDGFTKVIYLDDGSAIKLHNNSQVYIQGDIQQRKIIKQITILTGMMKLDVANNSQNEFKIISPTSVATIKGTRFWINVNGDDGDKFFGLQGIVNISNNFSNKTIQLLPNRTVVSLPDGTLYNEPTKSVELQKLENLEINSGESNQDFPEISDPDTLGYQNQHNDIKQLHFKILNNAGDQKNLIIKYTD